MNSPVLGPDGEVIYIIHRVEDVTEFVRLRQEGAQQQKMTDELRARAGQMEREAFLRAREVQEANSRLEAANRERAESAELLEVAHDAIIIRDLQSRIRYWNHGAQETYGWTSEEALGKATHSFLQTKFPISLQAVDEQLVNVGTWEGELAHTTRDGQRIVALSRQVLRRDETGKPSAILEINRDITARKKIEEALQQSDQRFRLLVDNVRDYAIFMLNPEGRVASWNEGAERLKGYRAEEIIGQHFSRFYPQEDIERASPSTNCG